MKKPHNLDIW